MKPVRSSEIESPLVKGKDVWVDVPKNEECDIPKFKVTFNLIILNYLNVSFNFEVEDLIIGLR